MQTAASFQPLFDYSLWENAIQSFFCDPAQSGGAFVQPPQETDATRESWVAGSGNIAFFTAYQNAIFQAAIPRVSLSPISYMPHNEKALILDANNRLQNHLFTVPLELNIVTKPNYGFLMSVLALVRSVMAQMPPVFDPTQIQTTGLNAYLTYHEVGKVFDAGNSLNFGKTSNGNFGAVLKYNANFAIRAAAWPGGTLTT